MCISDIHYDYNSLITTTNFLGTVVSSLEELSPEVLLITGDIDNKRDGLEFVLKTIREVISKDSPILFVPGNHDVWFDEQPRGKENSERRDHTPITETVDKYYNVLPNICSKHNVHYLPNNPTIISGVGFAGTVGWYDYSFRERDYDEVLAKDFAMRLGVKYSENMKKEFVESRYSLKQMNNNVWMDGIMADWGFQQEELQKLHTDRTISDKLIYELQKDLSIIENSCDIIIVGTHHVPFADFVLFKGRINWDYFSAFMGSRKLGEKILENEKVKYAVFGHTHFPKRKTIEGRMEGICAPIGLHHEFLKAPFTTEKYKETIMNRMVVIDI